VTDELVISSGIFHSQNYYAGFCAIHTLRALLLDKKYFVKMNPGGKLPSQLGAAQTSLPKNGPLPGRTTNNFSSG